MITKPAQPMKNLALLTSLVLFLLQGPVRSIAQEDHSFPDRTRKEKGNRATTTWTGNSSKLWTDPLNWDNGVPDVFTDVVIPMGRPRYPLLAGSLGIDTVSASIPYACLSLEIDTSAQVNIDAANADLLVKGTVDCSGEIWVADDIILFDGAQFNVIENLALITNGRYVGYYGALTINSGATLTQSNGRISIETLSVKDGGQFNGDYGTLSFNSFGSVPASQTIEIDDPDSYFDFISIVDANVTTSDCSYDLELFSLAIQYGSTFTLAGTDTVTAIGVSCAHEQNATFNIAGGVLNIDHLLSFYSDSHFGMTGGTINCDGSVFITGTGVTTSITGGDIYVRKNFISHNGIFQATGGTVTLYGDTITDIDGSPTFYNLVIDKDPGYMVHMEVDSLLVTNDLTIDGGYLDPENQPVYVGGNWTNNIGDGGFIEGTSTVTLDGANSSDILTDEIFYDLVVDKSGPGYDALDLATGITVTIEDDLRILDGGVEMNNNSTLLVGDTLYIELDAGLNANSDPGLSIEAGGDWINNNTYYNTAGTGFSPGTSLVTFNGPGSGSVTFGGDKESFYNVTLFRPNDTLYLQDSVEISGDLYIPYGVLNAETGGHLTLWGDLTLESGGKVYECPVTFTGTADQLVTHNSTGSVYGEIVVNKEATGRGDPPGGKQRSGPGTEPAGESTTGDGSRAQTLTFANDVSLAGNADLIIEEGTLNCNDITLQLSGNLDIRNGGTFSMSPGGTIEIGGSSNKISVNNGGIFETLGTGANGILVTYRDTDPFGGVIVRDGGTIRSRYTWFENMVDSAVFIADGALIDPAAPLDWCRFEDGESGGTMLTINNDQALTLEGLDFGNNSWGGNYNIAKLTDQGRLTMVNIYGPFAGPLHENDPNNRIDWPDEGTWLGNVSSDWNAASNWMYGLIPDLNRDAIIPGGRPNDPHITSESSCRNLVLQQGATLTLSERLSVNENADISGTVILDTDSESTLDVDENITWKAGSQCTDIPNTYILTNGDWTFEAGSNVQLDDCQVLFTSFFSQSIVTHESNSAFNYVRVLTFDTLFFSDLSTDSLFFNSAMVIETGSFVEVNTSHPLVFDANIISFGGGLEANAGEIIFKGITAAVDLLPGNYLNNVKILTTAFPLYVYNTYSDSLIIKGDLHIGQSGSRGPGFDPQGNTVIVYGDWTNEIGDAGFSEGTGKVVFKGATPSIINSEETFYDLIVDKTYSNYDGLSAGPGNGLGVDITVVNSLEILDGTVELNAPCNLTIGDDILISNGAGLNANDPGDIDIYVGGHWNNPNATSSSTAGFSHLGLGTVTFNGQHSNPQNVTQSTSFNDIIINRPTGEFLRPLSSNLLANDIEVSSGALRTGGKTVEVYNNLIIHDRLWMSSSSNDSLLVHGDITWKSGSEAMTSLGEIRAYRHWTFEDGCDVQIDQGCKVRIFGQEASYFYCMDETSSIGTLILDKDTAFVPLTFLAGSSTHDLHISGNLTINEGNELRVQSKDLLVNGTCVIDTLAVLSMNATLGNMVLDSTLTVKGHLNVNQGSATLDGLLFLEAPGMITIAGGELICTTTDFPAINYILMYGTLNLSSGLLEITGKSLQFMNGGINNISGGTIRAHKAFIARSGSGFQPVAGTLECIGPLNSLVKAETPAFVHNLTIDQDPYAYRYLETHLEVKGNLRIEGGELRAQGNDITLYGNWVNLAGNTAFNAGSGKVYLEGSNTSTLTGRTTFDHLEVNKPLNGQVIFGNHTTVTDSLVFNMGGTIVDSVTVNNILILDNPASVLFISASGYCETEYLDQGGKLDVSGGFFIAYDIMELMGLEGEYQLANDGAITLVQDLAGYCDIGADITISGGDFLIAGGHDRSYWPASGTSHSIVMSGGTLNFSDVGIYLRTGLTANISGGHIKTTGDLTCMTGMTTFQPSGGIFEIFGNDISTAYLAPGSWLFDMWVNKPSGYALLNGDLKVKNELRIKAGMLRTNGYLLDVSD